MSSGSFVVVGDAAGSEQLVDQPPDLARRVERAQRVLRDERDLAEAEAVHRRVVADRQLRPVELDAAPDVLHAAVEADEALAERRLAAAGLAREPDDLAVRDREGDAVDGLHVAVQRAVVHAQVVDAQAHVRRSLGLKTSSRPTFMT